jgi:hypothetical protein
MIVTKAKAEKLLHKKLKGRKGSYYVLSEHGDKNLGGPYSLKKAKKRLAQVEYFKRVRPNPATEPGTKVCFTPSTFEFYFYGEQGLEPGDEGVILAKNPPEDHEADVTVRWDKGMVIQVPRDSLRPVARNAFWQEDYSENPAAFSAAGNPYAVLEHVEGGAMPVVTGEHWGKMAPQYEKHHKTPYTQVRPMETYQHGIEAAQRKRFLEHATGRKHKVRRLDEFYPSSNPAPMAGNPYAVTAAGNPIEIMYYEIYARPAERTKFKLMDRVGSWKDVERLIRGIQDYVDRSNREIVVQIVSRRWITPASVADNPFWQHDYSENPPRQKSLGREVVEGVAAAGLSALAIGAMGFAANPSMFPQLEDPDMPRGKRYDVYFYCPVDKVWKISMRGVSRSRAGRIKSDIIDKYAMFGETDVSILPANTIPPFEVYGR